MGIHLIVATDNKNGIAKEGKIPWYIKEDLQHFKNLTSFPHQDGDSRPNALIMGRKTFETLPKALPGRVNYVISNTLESDGTFKVYRDLQSAVKDAELSCPDVFIIGGEQVYKEALETLGMEHCVITEIGHDFQCDQFCDPKSYGFVKKIRSISVPMSESGLDFTIHMYVKP